MSALDLVCDHRFPATIGQQIQAASELAALRAEVTALRQAVNEARKLLSEFDGVSSRPLRSRIDAWLAAHPAAPEEVTL